MENAKRRLAALDGDYSVCRLPARDGVPAWALAGELFSVTRAPDELSVVCRSDLVPEGVRNEPGWRCLGVEGPIAFSAVGVLASLAGALAAAGVSLFAVSTFDTDYLLVKAYDLARAVEALRRAGHEVAAG
jgi:hypothetical protein